MKCLRESKEMLGHREFLFLWFLSVVKVSRAVGLTIDNQLVIIANDCYTRVSIGSKIPDADISFTTGVESISECEDECSKKRNSCNAFTFGISTKGNGTCALSAKVPKPEELKSHPDYDVYVRSQRSPHCEPDRLYQMGSGIRKEKQNDNRPVTVFGTGLLRPITPGVLPSRYETTGKSPTSQGYFSSLDEERRISDILRNKNQPFQPQPNGHFQPSYAGFEEYEDVKFPGYSDEKNVFPSEKPTFGQKVYFDKDNTQSYNLETLQKPDNHGFRPSFNENFFKNYESKPFDVFSKPIQILDGFSKVENKPPAEYGFWLDHDSPRYQYNVDSFSKSENNKNLGVSHQFGGFTPEYHTQGILKTEENKFGSYDLTNLDHSTTLIDYNPRILGFTTNSPAKEANGRLKEPEAHQVWNAADVSSGFVDFGKKIAEKSQPCYRRLFSGKKILDTHVRRGLDCDRVEDCHRACDFEKVFVCEGFNYRRANPGSRGRCELTSTSYPRMNIHRDFIADPQCDYYERDTNCLVNPSRPSWQNSNTPSRPYGPPGPYPLSGRPPSTLSRPFDPNRRPLNEIPRPLDHDGRPMEVPRPLSHNGRPPIHYGPTNGVFYQHDRRPVQGYPGRPSDRFPYGRPYPVRPNDEDFYRNFYPGRTYPKYPDRRVDYGVHHDIGTNEIGTYPPDNRKNPSRDWRSHYGTVYGGSYGYDTNYVGHFDIPTEHRPQHPPLKQPRPYENDHFYGQFYNYGGAFGYGDNYALTNKDPGYGGHGRTEECSVRAGAGFKLGRNVIRKTYLTGNLDQCESLCTNEKGFFCVTFAYRYNVAPTDPTDNCLISDTPYRDLNFYTDLEPDRSYDIYAITVDPKVCYRKKPSSRHPPDECFWRVRSGFGIPTDVTRKTTAAVDLGECQAECTSSREFTCRSFVYRYGQQSRGRHDTTSNCFLSDWPSQEVNPINMPDMDGAELYERGSFGRGCEPYPFPPFNLGKFNGRPPPRPDEVCYSGYHRPCRLTPYVVLMSTRVDTEMDCRRKCSRMREKETVPCMSYSYKISGIGKDENCLLSDVPVRDLRPGLDYIYDDDHILYSWRDLDPYCVVMGYSIDDDHVFGGYDYGRPMLPRPDLHPHHFGANYPSVPPNLDPDPRPFGHGSRPPYSSGNGDYYVPGVKPLDPDKPDPVRPLHGGPINGYDGHDYHGGHGLNFDYKPTLPYPDEYQTFQHYTVNGYPCKRGTKCERNKIVGFWSCETEGSEYGSWDYCCEPRHHCGFSQGYHYPWCYVGPSEDQWRPCSERYYPYLPSPRPIRPQIDFNHDDHRHPDPYDIYHDSHGSGYQWRHWPITYLHGEPPPNCTDSLASADSTGDRNLNTSTIHPSTTAKSLPDEQNVGEQIRKRLRSRMTFDEAKLNNSRVFTRRTGTRFTIGGEDRLGKIERILKPRTTGDSSALGTAATSADGFRNGAINGEMNEKIFYTENDERKLVLVPLKFADGSTSKYYNDTQ